ncbi:MAG: VPLPA-CTERM sorting domain-containing protein [Gammaproteobacteria bacterium]|nr:VPLPA-CTERM sorting domain-containing protein [Gammaproteobacteria bacterium]
MSPVSLTRTRRVIAAAALLALGAGNAAAMTVVYSWVPDTGQLGSGSLTIDSPAITDPANFAAIPVGSLIGLTYTWNNGATINLGSVVTNNAPSWTACAGYLITGFQITANAVPPTPGTFSLSNSAGGCYPGPVVVPGPGYNATNSVLHGAEGNSGHWMLSTVVPVPGAVWLLLSGVATLAGIRMRRGR